MSGLRETGPNTPRPSFTELKIPEENKAVFTSLSVLLANAATHDRAMTQLGLKKKRMFYAFTTPDILFLANGVSESSERPTGFSSTRDIWTQLLQAPTIEGSFDARAKEPVITIRPNGSARTPFNSCVLPNTSTIRFTSEGKVLGREQDELEYQELSEEKKGKLNDILHLTNLKILTMLGREQNREYTSQEYEFITAGSGMTLEQYLGFIHEFNKLDA